MDLLLSRINNRSSGFVLCLYAIVYEEKSDLKNAIFYRFFHVLDLFRILREIAEVLSVSPAQKPLKKYRDYVLSIDAVFLPAYYTPVRRVSFSLNTHYVQLSSKKMGLTDCTVACYKGK